MAFFFSQTVKSNRLGLENAVLRSSFHLQKCDYLLGSCTQHFVFMFQYVTGKHEVTQFFLTRLDQLQYHFSCSDEICLENYVLKMHFLVGLWNDVYARGACGL